MVIEHAERFGLAQLHQLRGRVGRGPKGGVCVMIADPTTDDGRARIEAIRSTDDGFRVSELDLAIRGPGELFGANGLTTTPDNPRGTRSQSVELRCKGKGEWNTYDVVAVDGVVKLAINGKFVNGVSNSSVRKGYLCLESEGAPIEFKNIRIRELP